MRHITVLSISVSFISALVVTKEGLKEPLIYCFHSYFTAIDPTSNAAGEPYT